MISARAVAAASGDSGAGQVPDHGPFAIRPQACRAARPQNSFSQLTGVVLTWPSTGASCRVTAAAAPYQARALTSPASPATRIPGAVGRLAIAAAAADRTRKLASSQPTARAGGRVR